MTKALQKAFEAASRLPDADQDELAAAILEELKADERWEAAFAGSQDVLARLADEALEEHRAGRTKPLDPDAL
jgi:histidinol-phosphate/aromatic aminotransferase/cobyric acid decarboxylase-like protein